MSLLNSFINQIGREMGRDAYRSVKKSVASSVKGSIGVSLNQSHLDSIRSFTVSPYDKVTHRNFKNLTNKILEGVDPKCFLFDDVYMEYVSLAEDLQKTIGSDQFNFLDEETDSLVSSRMKADVKKHIDWLKSLGVVFGNDLEDNSKILKDIKSKNPIIKFLMTFIGLNAVYCDYGAKKFLSIFSLIWVILAAFVYTGNTPKPDSVTVNILGGIFFHSLAFIPAKLLRPKEKDYQKKVDDLNSHIKILDSHISTWEKFNS
jgi:hypothetical protein